MTGYRWLGKIEGDGEFGHSVGTGSEFVEKKNSFRISQRLTDSVMEKTDFIFQNTTHLNFPSVGTGGMQYFRFSPTTMPFHMNKPTYMGHYKPMIHERATLVHVFSSAFESSYTENRIQVRPDLCSTTLLFVFCATDYLDP